MTYVFDSFRLIFARIRLFTRTRTWFSRRGRRPKPSPTAVLLVVVVPFIVGA